MKKISLSIILMSTCIWATAQHTSLIDSIRAELAKKSSDVDGYYLLHDLALDLIDHNNEKALVVIEEAAPIAIKTADTLCIVKSQRVKGQILFRLGMPREAISAVEPLLALSTIAQHAEEYLAVLNLVAVCRLSIGQFDDALRFHLKTLLLAKEIGDGTFIATSLMNIGICYYKLRDYSKALPFMLRSYHMSDSLNRVDFSEPLNISLCYAYLNEFEKARHYLILSKELCGSACPPSAMLHIKYASGYINFGLHTLGEAERDYITSLEIARELNDHRMYLDNIYMLAKIHTKRNDYESAAIYLDQAQKVINRGVPFNIELIKVYGQMGELYLQIGDYERASYYQSQYILLKDSIYTEAVTTNLMEIETEYRQKTNISRIEAQTATIADHEQTIQRQQILTIVIGLLCLMTVVTLAVIIRDYRLKKTINAILERKIRERTIEMEAEIGTALINLKAREYELSMLAGIVNETVKSLTGLSNAVALMGKDDLRTCITQLRNMMLQSFNRVSPNH